MLILSVLAVCLNVKEIVGQSDNSNNLIISELQSLLSQTQRIVHVDLNFDKIEDLKNLTKYSFLHNFKM